MTVSSVLVRVATALLFISTAATFIDATAAVRHLRSQISAPSRPPPAGDIYVHDPSGVVYEQSSNLYFAFGTGILTDEILASHVSTDGFNWQRGKPVFTQAPDWVATYVPNYPKNGPFWAPDIVFLNGLWHLYYAVSSFGSQTSCIGLAVNQDLDPNSGKFGWLDQGPVLCSNSSLPYNCIDPHVFVSPDDNTIWMNYGSYWQGIFVTQLNGYPIVRTPVGTKSNLAQNHESSDAPSAEASWVQPHVSAVTQQTEYWLFLNWGFCCRGVNSTYKVMAGRSTSGPTGPYLDQNGTDLLIGGGSELLATSGRQIGPGQIGFPWPDGFGPAANTSAPVVSYHYYDLDGNPPGEHTLGQASFIWGTSPNQWPMISDRE